MILWIVAADSAGARIAEVQRRNDIPRLFHTMVHPLSRAHGKDIVTDRPGYGRRGSQMEAKGQTTDPKEVEFEEFARQLAEYLRKEFNARRYEALAIVAPAHFLGLLREDLSPEVAKTVVLQQTKDFAYVQDSQLPRELKEAVDPAFAEFFARSAVS